MTHENLKDAISLLPYLPDSKKEAKARELYSKCLSYKDINAAIGLLAYLPASEQEVEAEKLLSSLEV
jgi:hypothetical protein